MSSLVESRISNKLRSFTPFRITEKAGFEIASSALDGQNEEGILEKKI
jgi:hypothetical protein